MGENSKIAWTHHSFAPWHGCAHVSPGCDGCYAESWAKRYGKAEWGPHAKRERAAASSWDKPRALNKKARLAGVPKQIFCSHLSDVFDNAVPNEWRSDLWNLVSDTLMLDWLILTKRPQNIERMLPSNWEDGYPHVWLGITAENQTEFDRRWPVLDAIPAAVRFVSYEPALGPLRLGDARPDWVICGCESGPKRRPMEIEWARAIRDECAAAGVSFFMKQLSVSGRVTEEIDAFPRDLRVREWPKDAAQ